MSQHTPKEQKEWETPKHEKPEDRVLTPEEARQQLGWELIDENNCENNLNNRCPR